MVLFFILFGSNFGSNDWQSVVELQIFSLAVLSPNTSPEDIDAAAFFVKQCFVFVLLLGDNLEMHSC